MKVAIAGAAGRMGRTLIEGGAAVGRPRARCRARGRRASAARQGCGRSARHALRRDDHRGRRGRASPRPTASSISPVPRARWPIWTRVSPRGSERGDRHDRVHGRAEGAHRRGRAAHPDRDGAQLRDRRQRHVQARRGRRAHPRRRLRRRDRRGAPSPQGRCAVGHRAAARRGGRRRARPRPEGGRGPRPRRRSPASATRKTIALPRHPRRRHRRRAHGDLRRRGRAGRGDRALRAAA